MQRALLSLAALALALTGCPGNNPTGTGKTTATNTAAKTLALSGSVIAPAGIVAQGAGNIVAQGGGNLVPKGGNGIVAQGAGNIVAQGAGNMRLLAAGGTTTLANTVVVLVHPTTLVEITRTKTDANGKYTFAKVTPGSYRVLAAGLKGDAPVTLSTLAKTGKAADINLATTCTMMACLVKAGNKMNDVDATKFQAMAAKFADAIKDVEPPDLAKPGNLPHWLGCHMTADIRSALDGVVNDMVKAAVAAATGKQAHVLQVPDLSSAIADATQQASQAATQATDAAKQATDAAKQAVAAADYASQTAMELANAFGIPDMAKAAAQLDGCE
jgi:hypothetical protein